MRYQNLDDDDENTPPERITYRMRIETYHLNDSRNKMVVRDVIRNMTEISIEGEYLCGNYTINVQPEYHEGMRQVLHKLGGIEWRVM